MSDGIHPLRKGRNPVELPADTSGPQTSGQSVSNGNLGGRTPKPGSICFNWCVWGRNAVVEFRMCRGPHSLSHNISGRGGQCRVYGIERWGSKHLGGLQDQRVHQDLCGISYIELSKVLGCIPHDLYSQRPLRIFSPSERTRIPEYPSQNIF